MNILVIGGTGTIGKAVVAELSGRHSVTVVSHREGAHRVDLTDPESIRRMYADLGRVDAVVSAAGKAKYLPLGELTDEDFAFSLGNKLMGQVNLVRMGIEHMNDGGSFTLISGVLGRKPGKSCAAVGLVNCGLEGFARAAALDLPRGIRVNVISPGWVTETLLQRGMDPLNGTPLAVVAKAFARSVEGSENGESIIP